MNVKMHKRAVHQPIVVFKVKDYNNPSACCRCHFIRMFQVHVILQYNNLVPMTMTERLCQCCKRMEEEREASLIMGTTFLDGLRGRLKQSETSAWVFHMRSWYLPRFLYAKSSEKGSWAISTAYDQGSNESSRCMLLREHETVKSCKICNFNFAI